MSTSPARRKERESSLELLKIIAIVFIVISHVAKTVGTKPAGFEAWDACFYDVNFAAENMRCVALALLYCFGNIGNLIFFICSAWFLTGDDKKRSNGKILQMLLDVWIISVLFLLAFAASGTPMAFADIRGSLFPTTFSNNWYITCYLIFYAIFPYLNLIIRNMSQKELLTFDICFFVMYYLIGFTQTWVFFSNELILFIGLYFIIAYIRKYAARASADTGRNAVLLAIGIAGYAGIIVLCSVLGLDTTFWEKPVLYWNSIQNPFYLLICLSAFNIFRQWHFTSIPVNRIAGLSLLVYLIHENLLFRTYARPRVFIWIHEQFGYDHLIAWVFLVSACLFAAAALTGFLYQKTVQRCSKGMSARIAARLSPIYDSIAARLMDIA